MKTILKAALTTASAAGLLLGSGTAAHADTPGNQFVTQTTAVGDAQGFIMWTDSAGTPVNSKTSATYVNGQFWDVDTDYTLNAWLERSTDGGDTWSTLSGVHSLSSGDGASGTDSYAMTDTYYDGPGYLARACFQFTSWSGAAVHCSAAL